MKYVEKGKTRLTFEMMGSVLVKYKKKLMTENIIFLGKSMSYSLYPHFQKFFKAAPPENEEVFFQLSSGRTV